MYVQGLQLCSVSAQNNKRNAELYQQVWQHKHADKRKRLPFRRHRGAVHKCSGKVNRHLGPGTNAANSIGILSAFGDESTGDKDDRYGYRPNLRGYERIKGLTAQ